MYYYVYVTVANLLLAQDKTFSRVLLRSNTNSCVFFNSHIAVLSVLTSETLNGNSNMFPGGGFDSTNLTVRVSPSAMTMGLSAGSYM